MHFYQGNFLCFALVNAFLGYREYNHAAINPAPKQKSPAEGFEREREQARLKQFKRNFIPIFLAVNGADWLQVSWESKFRSGLLILAGTVYLPTLQRYLEIFRLMFWWACLILEQMKKASARKESQHYS